MERSSDSPAITGSSLWRTGSGPRGDGQDGIKYSLTLHDPDGRRIYGIDNAHRAERKQEFDHRHAYGGLKIIPYAFRGPVALLEDFYREVERILHERGVA